MTDSQGQPGAGAAAPAPAHSAAALPGRIATLDIVRGVAVMGILLMNIVAFAMPQAAYFNPAAYGGAQGLDLAAWGVMFVAIDGKMRGLFAMLFGASMLLVIERADARGENGTRIHLMRMAWLLLLGLAHLYLVWPGDILVHYALVGLIAFLFRHQPTRGLVVIGLLSLLLGIAMAAMLGTGALELHAAAFGPDGSEAAQRSWQAYEEIYGVPDPTFIARDLAAHRGSFADLLTYRRLNEVTPPLALLGVFGPETLGYMLLGMAGLRSGLLTGAWPPRRYARWAAIGFAISLPPSLALAMLIVASDFNTRMVIMAAAVAAVALHPIMTVAWAALIIRLTRHGGALVDRIAAAGRMALSNYLGTSLICATLFYGFGLYGSLGRITLYFVVAAIWGMMLLWSRPWLDRFVFGPFEWLWRSLARGRIQPLIRKQAIAT
ncbi:uncharacterized protein FHS96_004494 [Sphingomonas zeicaulis]|uniref:DUF418 domain-containing protein n=1 Tax=Sphingomonas zeicaulis TaxID=1632740 RepID=UPI003D19C3FF